MLSHDLDALQTADPFHAAVSLPSSSALYRSSSDVEDALEDAVDRACAPLIGTVPRKERLFRRAALRQELDTLVTAHCELTAIPEEAVAEAIAHFARLHPAPALHAVPQTLTVTCQASTKAQSASARPAALFTLALLLPVYLLHIREWTEAVRHSIGLSEIALYRIDLFLVPLLAGLLVGAVFPRRGLRGIVYACAILAAYAVGFPSVMVALSYTKLLPFEDSSVYQWLSPNIFAGYAGLVLWPLLGCAGAAAGARLKTMTARRRFAPVAPLK